MAGFFATCQDHFSGGFDKPWCLAYAAELRGWARELECRNREQTCPGKTLSPGVLDRREAGVKECTQRRGLDKTACRRLSGATDADDGAQRWDDIDGPHGRPVS